MCAFCAADFYRPHADSPARECTPCSAIPGTVCGSDTTIANLGVAIGYWRHSEATIETHYCKTAGAWTPCMGGFDAGNNGNGYCAAGYRGPRCELCDGPLYSQYFDEIDLRCHDCGDITSRACMALGILIFVLLAGTLVSTLIHRSKGAARHSGLLRRLRGAQKLWLRAGMRFKMKAVRPWGPIRYVDLATNQAYLIDSRPT
eukprot:3920071-Prymnesium_polylepis.4